MSIFNGTQFKATKWEDGEQKAKFANHFVKFVEGGFKESDFHDWFYKRLSMTRGHIAHYNREGFYDAQFSNEYKREQFLQHWMNSPIYGDPEWTYSDVERALQAYLRKTQSLFA